MYKSAYRLAYGSIIFSLFESTLPTPRSAPARLFLPSDLLKCSSCVQLSVWPHRHTSARQRDDVTVASLQSPNATHARRPAKPTQLET